MATGERVGGGRVHLRLAKDDELTTDSLVAKVNLEPRGDGGTKRTRRGEARSKGEAGLHTCPKEVNKPASRD
jgi:hypothetical protein